MRYSSTGSAGKWGQRWDFLPRHSCSVLFYPQVINLDKEYAVSTNIYLTLKKMFGFVRLRTAKLTNFKFPSFNGGRRPASDALQRQQWSGCGCGIVIDGNLCVSPGTRQSCDFWTPLSDMHNPAAGEICRTK